MTTFSKKSIVGAWACAFCLLPFASATAEIVLLDGGKAVSVAAEYVYAHPAMRSVVFSSPQVRDMAILPPAPYFLTPAPLLLRVPSPFVAYPPVANPSGFNTPSRPSNRDVTTYNIGRAHAFGQGYYSSGSDSDPGSAPVLYALPYGALPYYPPVIGTGGFNQPVRPSNRDNTTYNLERARRFSADAYKKTP